MTRKPHTLARGAQRHTFARSPHGLTVTYWWGDTWLVRLTMDAAEALACWRRLRRAGYRPQPKE